VATTDLTATEIRGTITTLQRSLGTISEVTVTQLADGRRVEKRAKTDAEKLQAIAYYEGLLALVTAEVGALPAPARLRIGTDRGLWPRGNGGWW
jgi:hypothetical protein